MTALANPRLECFARALAGGAAPKAAALSAGYVAESDSAKARAARPPVLARVRELEVEAANEGRDLRPVITRLMTLATTASELGTVAGMVAAHGLLTEAAKLKGMLPPPPRPRIRSMGNAEWMATFAPKPEDRV